MSISQQDNKKILKNSLFLYVRMIFVMCVNLYVVRLILGILGVVDYGIYNVIYGVVSMFSFLNGTLATSSQRYFSVAIAEGDQDKLKRFFSLNISVFLIFIAIIVVLLETFGLWYINNKMTIPLERMFAANVIFQFSIVSFVFSLIQVPLNALVIAHERMEVFAYIGIGEALFKFVIVLSLISPFDKLIVYGVMSLLSSFIVFSSYFIFCRKNFPESKYIPYWNIHEVKDIASFSGWHLLGTTSIVVRNQGVNLLISTFFNPAVNGARAIAVQIDQAINQLSQNFFVAVKPQIYKTYAANQMPQFISLLFSSTIICTALVSLVSIPLIVNVKFVLGIWLTTVPDYTILFTQLVLFNSIADSTSNTSICAALATKKIKVFYIITGSLIMLNLPISYIMLNIGYGPEFTIIVSIIISVIAIFVRAIILKSLVNLPIIKYMVLIVKLTIVTCIIWYLTCLSLEVFENSWGQVVFSSVCSSLLHIVFYIVILPKVYRDKVFTVVRNKLYHNKV